MSKCTRCDSSYGHNLDGCGGHEFKGYRYCEGCYKKKLIQELLYLEEKPSCTVISMDENGTLQEEVSPENFGKTLEGLLGFGGE